MSKLKKPYVFLNPSEVYTVIKTIKKEKKQHNEQCTNTSYKNKGICIEF